VLETHSGGPVRISQSLAISARERGDRNDGGEIKEATMFDDAVLQASAFGRGRRRVVGLGRSWDRVGRSGRRAGGARWARRTSGTRRLGRPWRVGCMELHGREDQGVIDVNGGRSDGI
jgi:hypothetical protein